MKISLQILSGFLLVLVSVSAGTWSDDFSEGAPGVEWRGDTNSYSITNGALKGVSISPLAPAPFHILEVGTTWSDYVVECDVNVVMPNLAVCSKGALLLRHDGKEAYVFAVHVATKTLEVYRLSDEKMLLSKDAPLEFANWYHLRAELNGSNMVFYVDGELLGMLSDDSTAAGAIGVAVQDVAETLFDNFTVTGPSIPSNRLTGEIRGKEIVLNWPAALSHYVLRSTTQLGGVGKWQEVTGTPSQQGDYLSLSVSVGSESTFFRLFPPE